MSLRYDRFFSAASPRVGTGHLLSGLEINHDNGSFEKLDEYHTLNPLPRYSLELRTAGPGPGWPDQKTKRAVSE